MSIKCIDRVWEYSKVGGSKLLILLAIADHAHDDGSGAYPSNKTLARKCKMSQRHIPRVVKELEDEDEIAVERGAGPRGTNLYTVLSGFTDDKTRRCFLCGEIDDGSVIFDRHHRIPGDDESIVDLCRPCHIKFHELARGDNMSYDTQLPDDMTPETQHDDIVESFKPSLTVNEPSSSPGGDDEQASLLEDKVDSRDETSLPSTKTQMSILMAGRVSANGGDHTAIADAESRLLRSGWNVRGREIRDRLVYLLAATGWDVPMTDAERKSWYAVIRDQHAKFQPREIFELYKGAYKRMAGRVLETDGDFSFPPRPSSLTKTMEGILEQRRIEQGGYGSLFDDPNLIRKPDGRTSVVLGERS